MNLAALHEIGRQESERQSALDQRVFCCTSTACLANGASATAEALRREVETRRAQAIRGFPRQELTTHLVLRTATAL